MKDSDDRKLQRLYEDIEKTPEEHDAEIEAENKAKKEFSGAFPNWNDMVKHFSGNVANELNTLAKSTKNELERQLIDRGYRMKNNSIIRGVHPKNEELPSLTYSFVHPNGKSGQIKLQNMFWGDECELAVTMDGIKPRIFSVCPNEWPHGKNFDEAKYKKEIKRDIDIMMEYLNGREPKPEDYYRTTEDIS